jgi:hypothetical protein
MEKNSTPISHFLYIPYSLLTSGVAGNQFLVSQPKVLGQGYTLFDWHCGEKVEGVGDRMRELWMLQTKQCLLLHLHLFRVWCT